MVSWSNKLTSSLHLIYKRTGVKFTLLGAYRYSLLILFWRRHLLSNKDFQLLHYWIRNATDKTLSFPPASQSSAAETITVVRSSIIRFLEEWSPHIHGRVLDIGVGNWTFSRNLLSKQCDYLGADIYESPNVDLVCDIHNLQEIFEGNSFDFVICTDVLEHLERPWVATNQIHQVLKTGGILLLTTPFNYPLHGIPGPDSYPVSDFWRITQAGLHLLLADFEEVNIQAQGLEQYPDNYLVVARK